MLARIEKYEITDFNRHNTFSKRFLISCLFCIYFQLDNTAVFVKRAACGAC